MRREQKVVITDDMQKVMNDETGNVPHVFLDL